MVPRVRFAVLAVPVVLAVLVLGPGGARALGPADVFLVTNRKVTASRNVAEHYCERRGVPRDHIVELDLPAREDISRADYDRLLVKPLRAALAGRKDAVKVLLTVYGVPLRVGRPEMLPAEREEADRLQALVNFYRGRVQDLGEDVANLESEAPEDPPGGVAEALAARRAEREAVQGLLRGLEARGRAATWAESEAAVDSELSLVWWGDYELRRWQMNPLYLFAPEAVRQGKPPVVMVARLDGPTPELAKRLVDQAIAAEAKGLKGRAYFDARGIGFNPAGDTGHGYGGYDESLREAARLLEKEAKLPVVLDDKPALFAPGACPECALYCGWYSLANYVDSCRFVPGAVAYHIASAEAVTLRDPQTRQWCKNLLEAGAAVTLGPVAEPYTVGFPKPAEFFGMLVTGKYPVVECYWRTMLFASWMTVLVGDPLYTPYGKDPRLTLEQVPASPQGAKPLGEGPRRR